MNKKEWNKLNEEQLEKLEAMEEPAKTGLPVMQASPLQENIG